MTNDVPDIVIFTASQLSTRADDHLVAAPTKVLLVMDQEILAPLHPEGNFGLPAVVGDANLSMIQRQY